jgi:hypothetical protein
MPDRHSWDAYERAAEHGPLKLGFKIVVGLLLFCIPVGLVLRGCSVANEAANVAHEQFGPREALRKYEWFKDAAAQLEKKQADIKVYDTRLASLKEANGDTPRSKWARSDIEQWSIWQSESAGVRASFNSLAAEYNGQMAKFNWRFANAGSLPKGADMPLPREFKSYLEN